MRSAGYYWVLVNKYWEVARWNGDTWQFVGTDEEYDDSWISKIGSKIERQIK